MKADDSGKQGKDMQVDQETIDGQEVVHLNGSRLDAAVVVQFKDKIRKVTAGGNGCLILDMTKVDFMDSSGLGAIVSVMKHIGPERKLVIAGLSATVAKVFKLTRMEKVFSIYPDVDAALAA